MKQTLIIADIAGQFNALMRLVARVENDIPIILEGDLVDRGPDSAKVVQWALENQSRVTTLMGNHEHMMLDFYSSSPIYHHLDWTSNGGGKTMQSYLEEYGVTKPPAKHLMFLESLPKYKFIDDNKCLITHAPLNRHFNGPENALEFELMWNRYEPVPREYFQIFGHNSNWGLRKLEEDGEVYAICIDQSQKSVLTGIIWPTLEILEEKY